MRAIRLPRRCVGNRFWMTERGVGSERPAMCAVRFPEGDVGANVRAAETVHEGDVGADVRVVETVREGDVGADVRVVETVREGNVGAEFRMQKFDFGFEIEFE